MKTTATARAHANIALVKYWGKRDRDLNLPATGSLSLTLAGLSTTTTVSFTDDREGDHFDLNGATVTGAALTRLSTWLDLVRSRAGLRRAARVSSANDFPTASGLASSASAYAALAVAATSAAGLDLDDRELSVLARRGSGSAARSIHGGLVEMRRGDNADGSDAFAEPIAAEWDLRMVIAIIGGGVEKKHPSRDAMQHCADTSPLYSGHVGAVPDDLADARAAIDGRDLDQLGIIAERSALTMHATAMAARPAIIYFQPTTLACIAAVHALRDQGLPAYFTIDAGPHVKVLTSPDAAAAVAASLSTIAGVDEVITSAPGGAATLIAEGRGQ